MIKPEISLQASVMSFDEAMQHWIATNPAYQKCLESLLQRFPTANQEIKQLYLLLTDAIYINDGLLFDYCLCKALHQYRLSSEVDEIAIYDVFVNTLIQTARSALDSVEVVAPEHGCWSIKSEQNFRDWLDEEPYRVTLLERWELEVVQ